MSEGPTQRPPSQATQLVELAMGLYGFGFSLSGEPYAVPKIGPGVATMFRGGRTSLRAELSALFCERESRAPSASALADAMLALEGMAQRLEPTELALRVAMNGSNVVLDLGRTDGEVVVITPHGWHVTTDSPVLFRRTELTGALPIPLEGGDLDDLRRLVNVSDETWPLLVAWLVMAMLANLPHLILLLRGEQGAGKSTAARLVGSVMDPSPVPLRTAPADVEAWMVAAAGSHVVPIDNVTTIAPWLSDALCRAVTGDGLVKRRLYSDAGLVVLAIRRVIILTSIDAGALRGDLGDRLLPIDLDRLGEGERRLDEELAEAFDAAHPHLLGALCTLLSQVLAELPNVRLAAMPRMADAARVMAAVDRVLGTDSLATYLALGQRVAAEVIESDVVAGAVKRFVEERGSWAGTAAEMLELLRPEHPPRGWPTDATRLAGRLRRAAPGLRSVGVFVDWSRVRGERLLRLSQGDAEAFQGDAEGDAEGDAKTSQRHPVAAGQTLFGPQGDAEDAEGPLSPSLVLDRKVGGSTPPGDRAIPASPASPASPWTEMGGTERHPATPPCGRCGVAGVHLVSWSGEVLCLSCVGYSDAEADSGAWG